MLLGTNYLLGEYFLPGTRHHLSACALYTVRDGGERQSENYGTKSMQYTWWSSWSQTTKSYTVFFCFWLIQSHFSAYNWTTRPSNIFPIRHRAPHYSLSVQWLWFTVSLRKMEPSDFMSILAKWMCLEICCTFMPACRVWLSFHPLFPY